MNYDTVFNSALRKMWSISLHTVVFCGILAQVIKVDTREEAYQPLLCNIPKLLNITSQPSLKITCPLFFFPFSAK